MKFSSKTLFLLSTLVLAGCASTRYEYVHKETIYHNSVQRDAFVQLYQFYIDNLDNKTSNPEMLRNYAIRLYENAGLRNKCIDNKCNLVYDDKMIRFEGYDIIVETSYSFLRTEDVHNAVNEIYGR